MGNPVQIRVLGTSFTIMTDQDPDYVATLVDYIREQAGTLARVEGSVDGAKSAILVALLITDELFRARRGDSNLDSEAEDLTLRMIKQIDAVLDDQGQ